MLQEGISERMFIAARLALYQMDACLLSSLHRHLARCSCPVSLQRSSRKFRGCPDWPIRSGWTDRRTLISTSLTFYRPQAGRAATSLRQTSQESHQANQWQVESHARAHLFRRSLRLLRRTIRLRRWRGRTTPWICSSLKRKKGSVRSNHSLSNEF